MKNEKNQRCSSIELFRIITMFIIVAHHYVVNSGLLDVIVENGFMKPNSIFLLLFGWGGKTGINCFVLITGYFMCKSTITLKKFLKLLFEVELYKIFFYFTFIFSGYSEFSIKSFLKSVLPFTRLTDNFTGCYIVFFLFIPFLNILIQNMNQKQHTSLILLTSVTMVIIPTLNLEVGYSYVSWFMIIYIIGSYIRLYPCKWFDNKKITGILTIVLLLLSWCSVIAGAWVSEKYDKNICYYFVADSNKALAVITAVCAFCFFKNLNIKYNKFINTVAASCFGVLLIHANSDAMRQWLWKDILNNTGQYNSDYLVLHAFGSVIGIYIICTIIDILRVSDTFNLDFRKARNSGILMT